MNNVSIKKTNSSNLYHIPFASLTKQMVSMCDVFHFVQNVCKEHEYVP